MALAIWMQNAIEFTPPQKGFYEHQVYVPCYGCYGPIFPKKNGISEKPYLHATYYILPGPVFDVDSEFEIRISIWCLYHVLSLNFR